jgi:hypothetical protein
VAPDCQSGHAGDKALEAVFYRSPGSEGSSEGVKLASCIDSDQHEKMWFALDGQLFSRDGAAIQNSAEHTVLMTQG